MTYEDLIYKKEGRVAQITISRPQVMNALSPKLLSELKTALLDAGKDSEVGVIVLTGTGRAFSAGVDLKSLGDVKLERGRVGPILDVPANDLIGAIQTVPKVVIAAVIGHCYTGALEIVLACDLIIASEEAKFGDTHARWGLRPSWGMSQRLPRIVGYLKAKEMSFTAGTVTAQEAARIGLVNIVVPPQDLVKTALEMANKILANSLESVAAYKYLYNRGMRDTMERGLELESRSDFPISDTEDRISSFKKKG